VLGDKMIDFEFLSDQNQNFPDAFHRAVNFEDENLNVSIPVFSIHGNHDDISGTGRLSSMDLLSSTGYVNYFGKWRDLSEGISA
jgi:double-strand break repair protein MRE11